MDPDINLRSQLARARGILQAVDDGMRVYEPDAERLAELVVALDEWITKGGFLPERWTKKV